MDKSRMVVIEHRKTGERYLFDLTRVNIKPYIEEYKLITMTLPLKEKAYLKLPFFNSYK